MILVDTNVWSAAFRRRPDSHSEAVRTWLRRMHLEHELVIPGIVLQELLSCLQDRGQVSRLRRAIDPIQVLVASAQDHHHAADIANLCRWRGVSTSAADCLIAAQAVRAGAPLMSLDGDFAHMAPLVPGLLVLRP